MGWWAVLVACDISEVRLDDLKIPSLDLNYIWQVGGKKNPQVQQLQKWITVAEFKANLARSMK